MVKIFEFNPIQERCYVLSDESREAVIIDCGALYPVETQALTSYIAAEGLTPVAHLLTHAHFDHIFGARFVFDTYGLKPRFAAADAAVYAAAEQMAAAMLGQRVQLRLPEPGEHVDEATTVACGTRTITVIATPGHTPGGVCYYDAHEGVLFSGDTLFRMSMGRTDLPGGNYATLIASVRRLLATLPPDTTVMPGHGPVTSIAFENRYNAFAL